MVIPPYCNSIVGWQVFKVTYNGEELSRSQGVVRVTVTIHHIDETIKPKH